VQGNPGGGKSNADKKSEVASCFHNKLYGKMPNPKLCVRVKEIDNEALAGKDITAGALWIVTKDVRGEVVGESQRGNIPTKTMKKGEMHVIESMDHSDSAVKSYMEIYSEGTKNNPCRWTLTHTLENGIVLLVEQGAVWVKGIQNLDGCLIAKTFRDTPMKIIVTQNI